MAVRNIRGIGGMSRRGAGRRAYFPQTDRLTNWLTS